MTSRTLAALSLSIVLAVTGCGGAATVTAPVFDGPALATETSDTGAHRVLLRLAPAAPTRAPSAAELTVVRTSDGAPEEGLSIAVQPWMPSMGHGSSRVPVVIAEPGGLYVVTDVVLFMPGEWQLRVTLQEGERVTFSLSVP